MRGTLWELDAGHTSLNPNPTTSGAFEGVASEISTCPGSVKSCSVHSAHGLPPLEVHFLDT